MVAAALVAGDLALRLITVASQGGDGAVFGTALVGAAFGCVAGLLSRRAPAVALTVAGAAAWLAALDVVGVAQAERLLGDTLAWRPWLVLAEVGLVGGAAVAAASAVMVAERAPRRWRDPIRWVAAAGVLAIGAIALATIGQGPTAGIDGHADSATIRLSGRAALAFAGAALALAVALLVRAPLARARAAAALETEGSLPAGGRAARFGRALVADLPGRRDRDLVAREEQARLAADIHAQLLPGLRRAARSAEAAGVPASVAADLQAAVIDAEMLMDGRESVVLEQFGLVAALELLAERTEARDHVEVTLDLDEPADARALRGTVARSAFRVALLAVDNAARHAGATRIAIGLSRDPSRTRLTIADDGTGFDPERQGARGRGLRDMAAEAARLGGTLAVRSRTPESTGTSVELQWPERPIAGNPAAGSDDLPAGDGAERARPCPHRPAGPTAGGQS